MSGRRAGQDRGVDAETRKRNLAMAIEILTAMYADPASTEFALERIEEIEEGRGKQGLMEAFSGLIELAVYGAAELGRLTGRTPLEVLQNFALNLQDEDWPET
jgi:hypothetical protein